MKNLTQRQLQRLGEATIKAENAERALKLLDGFTQASWRHFTSTERRQIYRAIADQGDTVRRLNKKVDRLLTYNDKPLVEARINRALVTKGTPTTLI